MNVLDFKERVERDGHAVLFVTVYGSHLYGTDTPDSDRDYYGLFLPNPKDLLLGKTVHSYRFQTSPGQEKNTSKDTDITFVDVRKVIRNFVKGEINAMDLLFAHNNRDAVLYEAPQYVPLKHAVDSGYLRICNYHGVLGYVWGQVTKYGMKGTRLGEAIALRDYLAGLDPSLLLHEVIDQLPYGDHVKPEEVALTGKGGERVTAKGVSVLGKTLMPYEALGIVLDKLNRWLSQYGNRAEQARKNKGVDWKAVSHAYRALVQAELYHDLGYLPLPLPEDERKLIIDLKRGLVPFDEAERLITSKMERVKSFEYDCNEDAPDGVILELYRQFGLKVG